MQWKSNVHCLSLERLKHLHYVRGMKGKKKKIQCIVSVYKAMTEKWKLKRDQTMGNRKSIIKDISTSFPAWHTVLLFNNKILLNDQVLNALFVYRSSQNRFESITMIICWYTILQPSYPILGTCYRQSWDNGAKFMTMCARYFMSTYCKNWNLWVFESI